MNVLSVEQISKTLNDAPLFENVTFGLESGEHVGLIGSNGCGKSTLLNILSGKLETDTGKVSMSNAAQILILEQTVSFATDDTVEQYLYKAKSPRFKLLERYHKLLDKATEPATQKQLADLTDKMEKDGTWNIVSDFTSILGELGLSDVLNRRMATLSGGEQKKVAIARVLCGKPTILLLDEPTNHLDIDTIEWLQDYLSTSNMTMIIVTHDRYFLNAVCTRIIELDDGQVYFHPGNYDSYLLRRAKRIDDNQKQQDRFATILRRELEWLKRGPQARTGKDSGRKDRIVSMQEQQKNVQDIAQNQFTSASRRLGKKILEVRDISKGFAGQPLFKDFSFSFTKGMRMGIIGKNGSGKSTLLDVLTGHLSPDAGNVDIGVNTVFGYYDQKGRNLNSSKSVLEYVEDISERITLAPEQQVTAARFLELFSFPTKLHRLPISTLSGGQRRRLYLISRLLSNPNFLVLDEPTNDLDVKTMENLESYIADFEGCCLIVSHDRAFLDHTCQDLLILSNQHVERFEGNYSSWKVEENARKEEKQQQERQAIKAQQKAQERSDAEKTKKSRKGLTYKEKLELKDLESNIAEKEKLVADLEASFATADTTELGTLQERTIAYAKAKDQLESMENRWLELSMLVEEA
ncbi:MAG: ATP-binding cassette domain-containing protein [Spirochaetia bacterium]|jgi:ATP-binding cassette subfamily F protein uup|nr:ATP-binding cassette domain-containing protein [Spirochaetia bacterium]